MMMYVKFTYPGYVISLMIFKVFCVIMMGKDPADLSKGKKFTSRLI